MHTTAPRTSWWLWVYCAVILAVPNSTYIIYWLYVPSVLAMLTLGAKLVAIAVYLAAQVIVKVGVFSHGCLPCA